MIRFPLRRLLGVVIIAAAVVTVAGFFLGSRLFDLNTYREQILADVQKSLGRQVSFASGTFAFHFGPAFTFTNVVVKEKDGTSDFITAERLTFTIAILPLLEKKLQVKDLLLDKAMVAIRRDRSGTFNVSDLLEEKPGSGGLHLTGIRLRKSMLKIEDQGISPAGVTTVCRNLDLALGHLGRGKATDVKLATAIEEAGKPAQVSVSGVVKLAAPGRPIAETSVNLKVTTKGLDAGRYWPYYQPYVPFRQVLGRLDIDVTVKGKASSFTSHGGVKVAGLRLDYPQIFHQVLTPRDVHFRYDLERTPQDVLVKSLDLAVDGLNVKGNCAVRDLHSGDPRITAEGITSRFRLEDYRGFIPYGIIVKDVADYIEQHIKGGTYKLDKGRLDGRVSQIVHMERGTNYNVLSILGRVENGLVSYGPSVPAFNSISGELEMRGKDFILRGMSGKFGGSPFTLDGKIADYPLTTPSTYPFTMNMRPRQEELAWLVSWRKGLRLTLTPGSQLHLSGEGATSGYTLSGDWDLTSAAYSCDWITKPAGRANALSFRTTLSHEEARFSAIHFNLAPMAVIASGVFRFAEKEHLKLDLRWNQFLLDEVAALLPVARKYEAGGRVQGNIHGEGSGTDLANLYWTGTASFGNFRFKPREQMKPVTNVNGTVTFTGTRVETSQLAAQIGSSSISGRGSVTDFKKPVVALAFSSPSLDLADLGFRTSGKEVRVTKVQGEIFSREDSLQIKSLTAQLNTSLVTVKGSITGHDNRDVDIAVTSPRLDMADLLLLKGLEQGPRGDVKEGRLVLRARISADAGRIGELEMTKFAADATYADHVLSLQSLDAVLFEGRLGGRIRMDNSGTVPRYQAAVTVTNVSAEQFFRVVGMKKQVITGALSLQGELSARGNDLAEVKKSAAGTVKLHCEAGTLRRFPILSKIFSILNVSQLLRFRLPDMVSGGMPYSGINGTFSVRDGVIATNDLFVSSNALNISAVGKVDMVKSEVDATIGVQPLQTIDKVVSRIPIVGWLLTGKDKALISAYFEAKGPLDDPKVSAIPVKAMARGVFDIFRRLFELPGKLITDTGEVIIGK